MRFLNQEHNECRSIGIDLNPNPIYLFYFGTYYLKDRNVFLPQRKTFVHHRELSMKPKNGYKL